MISLHFLNDGREFFLDERDIETVQPIQYKGGAIIGMRTSRRFYEVQESPTTVADAINLALRREVLDHGLQ